MSVVVGVRTGVDVAKVVGKGVLVVVGVTIIVGVLVGDVSVKTCVAVMSGVCVGVDVGGNSAFWIADNVDVATASKVGFGVGVPLR